MSLALWGVVLAACADAHGSSEPAEAREMPPEWPAAVERLCAAHPGEPCALAWSWLESLERGDCRPASARLRSVRAILELARTLGGGDDSRSDLDAISSIHRGVCPEDG